MKNIESSWFALFLLLVGGLHVGSIGCSTAEPPKGEPIEFSSKERTGSSGLEFTIPEGWIEEDPSSAMRKRQFRLPGPEPLGGDAEVAVFVGIGGSVEQNVERWTKQFQATKPPQVNERIINNFRVTLVDVAGTFSSGMMRGQAEAKPGYRMLAAVIEADEAPWFVKMVGPQDTVTKWETSFTALVESVRQGG